MTSVLTKQLVTTIKQASQLKNLSQMIEPDTKDQTEKLKAALQVGLRQNINFQEMLPRFKPEVKPRNSEQNFELLLSTWDIINKIYKRTQKDFEIYDNVKEYVDLVQEHEFDLFWQLGTSQAQKGQNKTEAERVSETLK